MKAPAGNGLELVDQYLGERQGSSSGNGLSQKRLFAGCEIGLGKRKAEDEDDDDVGRRPRRNRNRGPTQKGRRCGEMSGVSMERGEKRRVECVLLVTLEGCS